VGLEDPAVSAYQVAQAVEFIRALQVHLRKMTSDLARVERQSVAGRSGRELQLEAAALRGDIAESKVLIDRLHRRYLNTS
jgi:hypothetical protein